MAPNKNPKRILKLNEKELTLWPKCKKGVSVPNNYVSLHSAGRNFAISFKVGPTYFESLTLQKLFYSQYLTAGEIREVIYGSRGGQFGYFLSPEV